MKLYCEACEKAHDLVPSAVERVVYTLGAMLQTAEHDVKRGGKPDLNASGYPDVEATCIDDALMLSFSSEGYSEHVAPLVEARRALGGLTYSAGPAMPERSR